MSKIIKIRQKVTFKEFVGEKNSKNIMLPIRHSTHDDLGITMEGGRWHGSDLSLSDEKYFSLKIHSTSLNVY